MYILRMILTLLLIFLLPFLIYLNPHLKGNLILLFPTFLMKYPRKESVQFSKIPVEFKKTCNFLLERLQFGFSLGKQKYDSTTYNPPFKYSILENKILYLLTTILLEGLGLLLGRLLILIKNLNRIRLLPTLLYLHSKFHLRTVKKIIYFVLHSYIFVSLHLACTYIYHFENCLVLFSRIQKNYYFAL